MRLIQLWARLFVASILAGLIALIFGEFGGAPSWAGTVTGMTIVAVGGIGVVVVVGSILRVRMLESRLTRAVAARAGMAINTPYDAIERAFAPLVEARVVHDLSVAVVLHGGQETGDHLRAATALVISILVVAGSWRLPTENCAEWMCGSIQRDYDGREMSELPL